MNDFAVSLLPLSRSDMRSEQTWPVGGDHVTLEVMGELTDSVRGSVVE